MTTTFRADSKKVKLIGDFQKKILSRIDTINKKEPTVYTRKYDNKKEYKRELSRMNNDADVSDQSYNTITRRVTETHFEDSRKGRIQLNYELYVIAYKNVWEIITEEELNKLMVDVEDASSIETLSELKVLDVSSIVDRLNSPKVEDITELKAWMENKINELEYKLRHR